MKRLLRYTLHLSAMLGLLVCIGTALSWWRTLRTGDVVRYITADGVCYSVDTHPHGVGFGVRTNALMRDIAEGPPGFSSDSFAWGSTTLRELPDSPPPPVIRALVAPATQLSEEARRDRLVQEDTGVVTTVYHVHNPPVYRFGFAYNSGVETVGPMPNWGSPGYSYRYAHVAVPFAFVILVAMLPVFLSSRRIVLHVQCNRRLRRNACVHCGYSRTGNLSGICPECGLGHDPS